MRKITATQAEILRRIKAAGGSYCPTGSLDPFWETEMRELVKAKRLSVEPNDGAPPRYSLTAQGEADAA